NKRYLFKGNPALPVVLRIGAIADKAALFFPFERIFTGCGKSNIRAVGKNPVLGRAPEVPEGLPVIGIIRCFIYFQKIPELLWFLISDPSHRLANRNIRRQWLSFTMLPN